MSDSFEIGYARSGDLHIAYEVLDANVPRGVEVLRIAAFMSNLEHNHALPTFDEGMRRLAALGRLVNYDSRGTGLSDRLRGVRLPSIEERIEHHRVVRGALARYRGRELDTAGDGFFAAFDGPARAIRCTRAIRAGVVRLGIQLRAGLHTGECRTIDGKVGGLAVSIGARVTSLAGPSEILVSQTVRDLVAGSGLEFTDRGEHELKGVPGSWRVFAVV